MATPYRGDGRPVAPEGMRLLLRSLAEHMAAGFAPGHLDSEIVPLGNPADAITADVRVSSVFLPLFATLCQNPTISLKLRRDSLVR
jgi:hypothetical protein